MKRYFFHRRSSKYFSERLRPGARVGRAGAQFVEPALIQQVELPLPVPVYLTTEVLLPGTSTQSVSKRNQRKAS